MTPYEVMLSESQERMLVIVKNGCEAQVAGLFKHWGLEATQIGHVTKGNEIRIYEGDVLAASLPLDVLTEPPLYTREGRPPEEMAKLQSFPLDSLPDVADANSALLRLLAAPNIASKRWIYRQYDHQLFTNTVIGPGADAALSGSKARTRQSP
jgi:phosphoribosylformylglycinamidine synthase